MLNIINLALKSLIDLLIKEISSLNIALKHLLLGPLAKNLVTKNFC